MAKPSVVVAQSRPLSQMRVCIRGGVNSLLAAVEWDAGVPGLHGDLFNMVSSLQLNGFSTTVASALYSKEKTILQ